MNVKRIEILPLVWTHTHTHNRDLQYQTLHCHSANAQQDQKVSEWMNTYWELTVEIELLLWLWKHQNATKKNPFSSRFFFYTLFIIICIHAFNFLNRNNCVNIKRFYYTWNVYEFLSKLFSSTVNAKINCALLSVSLILFLYELIWNRLFVHGCDSCDNSIFSFQRRMVIGSIIYDLFE